MAVPSQSVLFQLTDNGSGGALQTLKRQLKFQVRAWLGQSAMRRVAHTLAHPALQRLPASDPHLYLRPLRSYLWSGMSGAQRTQAFAAHFEWLRNTLSASHIDALYGQGGLSVVDMHVGEGHLTALLTPARGLAREGELELHFIWNGQTLLRAAFCVLPAPLLDTRAAPLGPLVMVIGCIQGTAGATQAMAELAQATHRSRLKALLMDVLQGLREGWGIDALAGVRTRAHVFARYRTLSKRVAQDYDAMWPELGAEQCLDHHWVLPNAPVLRADHEVPARKRAENRRRCELRRTLYAQASQAAAAM